MSIYNKVLVTVIIPVYNTQDFLIKCLNSVIKQTLKNIEILIIDDGSTDNSLNICKSFAAKDYRVKLIHKNNEGLGRTYNLGLSLAKGEYIGFVESDDFIDSNMFKTLYEATVKYNKPDMVKTNYISFSKGNIKKNNKFKNYKNIFNKLLFDPLLVPEIYLGHPSHWSAIYRKDFLHKNNIIFNNTDGAAYQDSGFSFLVYCNLKKFVIIENSFYYYRTDNNLSSQNKSFCSSYQKNINERFYISNLFYKNKINIRFKEVEALKILHSFKHYLKMAEKEHTNYYYLYVFLKKYKILLLNYDNIEYLFFSKKEKIHFKLIKKMPILYFVLHVNLTKLKQIYVKIISIINKIEQ